MLTCWTPSRPACALRLSVRLRPSRDTGEPIPSERTNGAAARDSLDETQRQPSTVHSTPQPLSKISPTPLYGVPIAPVLDGIVVNGLPSAGSKSVEGALEFPTRPKNIRLPVAWEPQLCTC